MHSVLLLALSASCVAPVPERSHGDLVVLLSMACGYLSQSKDIISLLRKKAVLQRGGGGHHQRPSGDLHIERWQEDSESDRRGDRDRVGGAGGEFSASVINVMVAA